VKTISDILTLRAQVDEWRHDGDTVAIVPTMGSLHKGHISLMQLASEYAERVVATVFVNPTQFGPNEDFEKYPRAFDADRSRLTRGGVDVMFAPEHEEIFPFGLDHGTFVSVPDLSTILCGEKRPGHFDGVTSVVNRLFNIVGPDFAVFGQKDYQQLVIIRRMVDDLHIPIKILACPTHREESGLAMSSRNRYLSDAEREQAPALYQAICECRDRYLEGERDLKKLEQAGLARLSQAGFEPEYLVIRKSGDLALPEADSRHLSVMGAARLGTTRLIDNVLFEVKT